MFSLLLVLFAIIGLSLLFFMVLILVSSPKKSFYSCDEKGTEIVKVVEAHRKILPISSAQGWSLVSSKCGLRCWKRELSLVTNAPLAVFGCTKQINCSAVIVLNVIADISTWAEWDVWAEGQTMHLEVAEDPSLHGDRFMQCDQLVVTTSAVQAERDVVMYRFGNLEHNGVGWILLWNAKHLGWTFYVAQPIDTCSSDNEFDYVMEKCMLTAIAGSDGVSVTDATLSDMLCEKVHNLSDAITNSYFKVRPLQPLMRSSSSNLNNPHFPAIHSALDDLPEKPCVLLKLARTRQLNMLRNCALAVVPVSLDKSGEVSEFQLISCLLKETSNGNPLNDIPLVQDEKRRSRKRLKNRSDSTAGCSPLIKHLQNEGRRSSSLSAPVARKKLPELMVTEAEDELKPPTRAASHSFLDLIFHRRRSSDASDRRSKSPSQSRCSTPPGEKKTKKVTRLSSTSSQEDFSSDLFILSLVSDAKSADTKDLKSDLNGDNTDIESYKVKSEPSEYKALGELCVSSLLRESAKASAVDINTSEEEQRRISGGWIFKEMNKDVTVLKKVIMSKNIISYLCKGLIPTASKVVWETLCSPMTRFMYDDTVKKISVLCEFPSGQKLIHMYNESVTFLKKEVQDFCLLQTAQEKDDKLILAFHSVDDKLCPPLKDVVRGSVITSGWIVEKVPEMPHATMISYLMQMVVNSPDNQMMEEISNIQCQCINNLSTYLASKPL